jgi:hypothetical protein
MFSRRAVRPAISAASCGVIAAHAPSSRHVPLPTPAPPAARRGLGRQDGSRAARALPEAGRESALAHRLSTGVEPDHPRRLARCMIPVPCLWQRLRGARSTGTRGRGRLTAHHPLPIL